MPIEIRTVSHARFQMTAERLGKWLCERCSTPIALKLAETGFVETCTAVVRDTWESESIRRRIEFANVAMRISGNEFSNLAWKQVQR